MAKGIIFDWNGTLYQEGQGLMPNVNGILQELQRQEYKLGLVTRARGDVDRKGQLESSGIMHYFDSVVIDVEKGPEQYRRCLDELGVSVKDAFVVDDRTAVGIKIGNKLGCITLWITEGKFSDELPNEDTGEPTHKIKSIDELQRIL